MCSSTSYYLIFWPRAWIDYSAQCTLEGWKKKNRAHLFYRKTALWNPTIQAWPLKSRLIISPYLVLNGLIRDFWGTGFHLDASHLSHIFSFFFCCSLIFPTSTAITHKSPASVSAEEAGWRLRSLSWYAGEMIKEETDGEPWGKPPGPVSCCSRAG